MSAALGLSAARCRTLDDGLQLAALWAAGQAGQGWSTVMAWPPARARRAAVSLAELARLLDIAVCYSADRRRVVEICAACNPGPDGERAAALARAILTGTDEASAATMHDSAAPYAAAGLAAHVAGLMAAEHGPAACARLLDLELFLTKGQGAR